VLTWVFSGEPAPEVLDGLFELRSIVEPAAAVLAAARRNQQHLDKHAARTGCHEQAHIA